MIIGMEKYMLRFLVERIPLFTHPQLHKYCIEKLGYKEVMGYMNIPYKLPSDNWWSDD